jgi:flagellar hook protein FlgE
MSAAETMIDVDGNNIANSNTVGFKASTATFATQFLQTQSLGSSPTANNGGTNPRQIGMGTMVAEITPNFTQGTVEISSNSTDMAIQGDGFFIVEGQNGGQEYTRNGVFKLNSDNELVTSTGNRVLGYGIDGDFQIQQTELVPLTIPLGSVAVAKATTVAELQGALTPTGDVATAAKIIQSGVLGDASIERPSIDISHPLMSISNQESLAAIAASAGGALATNTTYYYRVSYSSALRTAVGFTSDMETAPSAVASYTIPLGSTDRTLSVDAAGVANPLGYGFINVYRSTTGNTNDYALVGTAAVGAGSMNPFVDNGVAAGAQILDSTTLSSTYNYYVAYVDSNGMVSRPSDQITGVVVANGRVQLDDYPPPTEPHVPAWTHYIIYRNYGVSGNQYVECGRVSMLAPTPYMDSNSDATLQARAQADPTKILNFNGPAASASTRLVDLVRNTGGTEYQFMFDSAGTLQFTGKKGGSTLAMKQLTVNGVHGDPPAATDTLVGDLLTFMEQAMGIQKPDSTNLIPQSVDTIANTTPPTMIDPGASIASGIIKIVGNNGTSNAVDISLDGMKFVNPSGTSTVNMPFTKYQDAVGQSTMTDFLVYDSLGTACNVRITADLESRSDTGTVYRWFADSPANSTPTGNPSISVGTGRITFDGNGKFVSATNDQVTIFRSGTPAVSPLVFTLGFSNISGLGVAECSLQMKSQDGSAPGQLASFIVGEDGLITGVFTNSIKRNLGQIRLARFANPAGLEQKGQNLYAAGVNSGVPIQGNPGEQGIGSIVAGAVELSNTDIGGSLTDLILASTMYRGNARVITTTQELFDELLALKR